MVSGKMTKKRSRRLMGFRNRIDVQPPLLLFVSPQGLESTWADEIEYLAASGIISLVTIDEAHKVPQDGRHFRPEFARLSSSLFSKLKKSPVSVPRLATTATFTKALMDDYKEMTSCVFDIVMWGNTSRRDISLSLSVKTSTVPEIKRFVKKHLTVPQRRVLNYTNDAGRARKNLVESTEAVVEGLDGTDGDVLALVGDMGLVWKTYVIRAFTSSESTALCNPLVLNATSCANCGISSSRCGAVSFEGLPVSLITARF
jgi:superfamily II DNA helicase RecQ